MISFFSTFVLIESIKKKFKILVGHLPTKEYITSALGGNGAHVYLGDLVFESHLDGDVFFIIYNENEEIKIFLFFNIFF